MKERLHQKTTRICTLEQYQDELFCVSFHYSLKEIIKWWLPTFNTKFNYSMFFKYKDISVMLPVIPSPVIRYSKLTEYFTSLLAFCLFRLVYIERYDRKILSFRGILHFIHLKTCKNVWSKTTLLTELCLWMLVVYWQNMLR